MRSKCTQQGILTTGDANYNQFIGLNVHDNGTDWHEHGMYIASSYNLIDSCNIYNNAGDGITVGSVNVTGSNTIRNCKLHDNARVGTYGHGISITENDSNSQVYNNLIWNNCGGILVDYGATNTSVYNNTVYNNTKIYVSHDPSPNIQIGTGSTGAIVRNNIA